MASKYYRTPKMTPMQKVFWQLASIRKTYSNVERSSIINTGFTCIMSITPSENSDTYKVEISYRYGRYLNAKLLSPALQKRDGKYPHHIFEFDKDGHAYLCVFHQKSDQWNSDRLISESFIPWVSTWLNTYEFWLITGEWYYDEVLTSEAKTMKDACK